MFFKNSHFRSEVSWDPVLGRRGGCGVWARGSPMSEGSAHAVFKGLSCLGCDLLFQSVLIASFCFLTRIYTLDKTAMVDTCFQESSPRSDPSLVLKFHCFPKTSKTTFRLFLKEKCCFWRSLAGETTPVTPMFPHLNMQMWTVIQNKTPVSGPVYPFASCWKFWFC